MRAIHVNTSTSWGGLEQYTLYMAKQLQANGVDVQIMATRGSRLALEAQRDGVAVINASKGCHIDPANIWRLRRVIDPQTIVHSHTRIDVWTASLACMWTKSPHVHSVHMIPADKQDPLHAAIYGRVDAIVNTCETHVRNIPKRFPVSPSRVHLIRHMRDPHEYVFDEVARAKYRSEWGIEESEMVVGYVARIDPLKGTREFVESVDHLSEADRASVRYIVVGEPSITDSTKDGSPILETASADLCESISLRASDPRNKLMICPFTKDVAGVMSAFDAFVLATYGEMYALTVLEAMMVGLPVIGTDTDGTPDQLADGRGLLVSSRSASAIAEGVTALLHDPLLRNAMASRGHEWAVREFDVRHVLPQWIELYRNVLRNRSGA